MAKLDKSKAPYYVRKLDDEYTELLFLPGMHIQNAEMNEIQNNFKNIAKGIGDTILTDGDIVSGAQIIIEDKKATVTEGRLYLEGMVRPIKKQSIEIIGKGTELIGVKIESEAVDHNKDKRLLSQAAGFENYNLPGAERLKETVVLAKDDPDASTLYVLQDGEPVNKVQNTDNFMDKLNTVLARRTYDESGHYKVWGMELSQKNQYEDDFLYASLSEGKAYVEGYEIEKDTATTIKIPRSISTRNISAEPKVYNSGTNKYKLNNYPTSKIHRVIGLIEVKTQLTRQGSLNGSDPIPGIYNPVVDIKEIKQVGGGTTYKKNTDYILESDSVRWLQGGKQPELGASYDIVFTYNKTMEQSKDYKLTADNNGYYLELLSGDKPVNASQMQIDYDFYLHTIHAITLDKNGVVYSLPGQPDTIDKVAPPDITDQNVLLLGYIRVAPMSDELKIQNSRNLRSEMSRIQRMFERLEDMELNQAISDLDKEAMEGEEATLLKGIITDGFIGWSKADVNHKEFSAAIDPINRELTVGNDKKAHELVVDKTKTIKSNLYDRLATVQGVEVLQTQQPYATESHLINPYTVFFDIPSVTLVPSVDNWTDTENVVIQRDGGTVVKTNNITTQGKEYTNQRWYKLNDQRETQDVKKDVSSTVLETAIEYMRSREVAIKGSKFVPNQRGITALFNDVKIELKATNSKYQGENGTVIADENGRVEATFTVPERIRCGTVQVKLYGAETKDKVGTAAYTSNGILRTNTDVVTNTTIVYRTNVYKYVDPLAQTFEFTEDTMINSVGVYLSTIDEKYPVTIQIRGTENSYPSREVLAEKILYPKELKGSDDGSVETKVTFDNPVYCKAMTQYAITILSESPTASMLIQDLGKVDLLTKQIVFKNPYIQGLMFSSSNALTWTAHQTKNIKFNIYAKSYEEKAEVYFNTISGVNYDSIGLIGGTSVPLGCSIEWEYSTDGGKNWLPIVINDTFELNSIVENITIKAILKSTGKISPTIAIDSLLLVGSKNKSNSNYISRNVTTDEKFTDVKIVVDVNAPSGTGVVFYYATDISGTEWKKLKQEESPKVKEVGGYIEYTYTAKETTPAQNLRIKAALTTNNSTIKPRVKNLKCIMKSS